MNIKIGIDTGGTFTDAVAICHDTRKIVKKAKARTTRENLAVGISKVIDKLQIKKTDNVCLVCLSTTLATNAIVEKKKSSTGLITIGAFDKKKFPAARHLEVRGKIGIDGCEVEPLDEAEIDAALSSMKGRVEALAVSGYASVRNPVHEMEIKKRAAKILGVPVVCAHELTSTLGYYERTVTSVLNASLIPIVRELILTTRAVLNQRNIDAQVFIFKGDGHVITDSFAGERPVETILSGPAASMVGGRFLSGCDHAIIADMGGTTTDVVVVRDGIVPRNKKGAVVGDWQTKVNTVQINTFGLGGDSHIRIDSLGGLAFGPERVIPLCVAAHENPALCDELENCKTKDAFHLVNHQETDCFRLFKKENIDSGELTGQDMKIVKLLESGSHSILHLGRQSDKDPDDLDMQKLMDMEIAEKISMTPTDLLHVTGEYREWNEKASISGAELLAKRLHTTPGDFAVQAESRFTYRICLALLQSICRADGLDSDLACDGNAMYFINSALAQTKTGPLDVVLRSKLPIVGLGRPAKAWFQKAAKALGTRLIAPEYHCVGSAVGAAVGGVREVFSALVRFHPHADKFVAYTPKNRVLFNSCEEAKRFARQELSQCAKALVKKLNMGECEISIQERDDYFACSTGSDAGRYVETCLTAVISAST